MIANINSSSRDMLHSLEALCGALLLLSFTKPAEAALVEVWSVACLGDDCKSRADCPAGYQLLYCTSDPEGGGDGLMPDATGCTAIGADAITAIRAYGLCSLWQEVEIMDSNSQYYTEGTVQASCPAGSTIQGLIDRCCFFNNLLL